MSQTGKKVIEMQLHQFDGLYPLHHLNEQNLDDLLDTAGIMAEQIPELEESGKLQGKNLQCYCYSISLLIELVRLSDAIR